jgi:MFS family permease
MTSTAPGLTHSSSSSARNTQPHLSPLGVFVLLMGAFLPIADFFIVNVALPSISETLHASGAALELVVAAYGIAYASLLVLGGRLGDRFGRRRMFLAALGAFVVMSLACGLAPDIGTLVAARLVQGVAAALLVPQVLATFHASLSGERKVRALAMYGAVSGLAAVFGQLAGGFLVTADVGGTHWRPIFLINIPVGALVLVAASRVVPATRSQHAVTIDLPGTMLFAATLTALLIPLAQGPSLRWPVWTWILLLAVPVLGVLTCIVESRTERDGGVPLLPPSLLRLPSVWRGLSIVLPFAGGFGAFMFVFALTVQNGLHVDALRSGLAISPMALLFLLGSLVSPKIIARYGRGALAAGAVIQILGLGSLIAVITSQWPNVGLAELAIPLALAGAGQSLVFTGLFRAVLVDCPPDHGGVGGGVLITIQQSGLALGVATLGSLFLAMAKSSVPHAFAVAIGAQIGVVALLALGTRGLPRFTNSHDPESAAAAPVLEV